MSTRISLLLAGAAMMAVTTPAAAHDEHPQIHHAEVIDAAGDYDGEWQGHWEDGDTWRGMWNGTYTTPDGEVLEGRYIGTFIGEGRFVTDDGRVLMLGEDGWHEGSENAVVRIERRRAPHELGASPDGRLGYTLAEREAWLADCRVLMANAGGYYDYDDYYRDDADGGLIGGLLGAVAGGFAGNRIADGDRLAGTLIGAGVGGIAGAVIGSLVDGDGGDSRDGREIDANELYAARYCEAYLRRYEMGGGAGFQTMAYQPVMMVQAVAAAAPHGYSGHRHGPECTTTVREEWVEVERPAPTPPARRVIPPRPQPAPAPEPRGKVQPID